MAEFTGFVVKSGESCTHYGEASENTRVNTAIKNLGFSSKDVVCIESYGSVVELETLNQIKSMLHNGEIQTIDEALTLYLDYKNNPQPVDPEDPADPMDSPEAKATAVMMRAMAPRNVSAATTMGLSTDDIIVVSVFYDEWKKGKFKVGDITKKDGWVWECKTEHDSTVNTDWVPGKAPTIWVDYHGKTKETAQPYRMEGGHNAYQKGEFMVYTDGNIYECLQNNTTWSPEEYPQNWKVVE